MNWIAPTEKNQDSALSGKCFGGGADQHRAIHPFLGGDGRLGGLTASLKHLAKLGIARETTGRNYARIYAYDKYLKILNEGTEPLN